MSERVSPGDPPGERQFEDLDDFERVSHLFYQNPRNGFSMPLDVGVELVYNENIEGWRVLSEDGALVDIVFTDRWKSAQLLCRYILRVAERYQESTVDDEEAWRWSQ